MRILDQDVLRKKQRQKKFKCFRKELKKKENKEKIKIEKGCTNPINGVKSKCIIRILF